MGDFRLALEDGGDHPRRAAHRGSRRHRDDHDRADRRQLLAVLRSTPRMRR